jgi:septum formation protein
MPALILASRSPIRLALLRGAGLEVEPMAGSTDERALEAGWPALGPAEVARRLAEAKARDVSLGGARGVAGRLVLGADQTLALGARRFSKAQTLDEARQRLRQLRGRTHELHSGFALVRDGTILASGVASAHLTMRDVSDACLDDYLTRAGRTVLGSVGCYQLEGLGVTLFSAIEGDYFTILGLPLLAVLASLRDAAFLEG